MHVVFPRCVGLDGHKKTGVACVLIRDDAAPHKVVQTFGTATADVRALAAWLTQQQVTPFTCILVGQPDLRTVLRLKAFEAIQ